MSEIREQLRQLQSLLQLEKEEEIRDYEAYAAQTGIQQRKADGVCWYPLEVKEEGYGLGDRPFAIFEWAQPSGKSHRFQAGQTVQLFTIQFTTVAISSNRFNKILLIADSLKGSVAVS